MVCLRRVLRDEDLGGAAPLGGGSESGGFGLRAGSRLVELGEWDPHKLGEVLRDLTLQELDFDIEAIGFDIAEIDLHILNLDEPGADLDRADELGPSGPATTRLGDLWFLDSNRVLCGDALAPEAQVALKAADPLFSVLSRYQENLRYLFIVSAVTLEKSSGNGTGALTVEVKKADGQKCDRCWNYSTRVGEDSNYPTVCERCSAVLKEIEAG